MIYTDPPTREIHPDETGTFTHDYTDVLPTSITLSSATNSAVVKGDGTDVSSTFFVSTTGVVDSNVKIQFDVTATKDDRTTYIVKTTSTGSDGKIYVLVTDFIVADAKLW